MSFTDQKPFIVTGETREAFIRHKRRFNCVLCGRDFVVGDTARWVYAGAEGMTNFFVCPSCDGHDVISRGKESLRQAVAAAKNWNIYGPDWQ